MKWTRALVLYVYKRCRRKSGRAVIKPGPIEGLSLANGISLSSVITGVTGNRYESSPIPVHQFITLVRKVGSHFRVIIKIARKRIHAVINQYRDYAFLLPRRPSTRSWTTRSVWRARLFKANVSIDSFRKKYCYNFNKDFYTGFPRWWWKKSFVIQRERYGLRHPKIKYRKIKHREKSDWWGQLNIIPDPRKIILRAREWWA